MFQKGNPVKILLIRGIQIFLAETSHYIFFFCAKIKAACIPGPKASWEEKGLLDFHFHIAVHPEGSQDRNSRRQEMMQGPWRGAAS